MAALTDHAFSANTGQGRGLAHPHVTAIRLEANDDVVRRPGTPSGLTTSVSHFVTFMGELA
jgi:hypothetical protein